jgi:hypothetical protein
MDPRCQIFGQWQPQKIYKSERLLTIYFFDLGHKSEFDNFDFHIQLIIYWVGTKIEGNDAEI